MIVRYLSHQNKFDPLNGQVIAGSGQLIDLLKSRRHQPPFIADLSADNGFQIVFGLGPEFCCVEYTRVDGDLPYLMAVSPHPRIKEGDVEFLAANTLTPIAARYILTFDELMEIADHFLKTGGRNDAFLWDSI